MEAGAPQLVDLDDRGVESELSGTDGRHVAAGPPTDEDDVKRLTIPRGVLLICHTNCSLFPLTASSGCNSIAMSSVFEPPTAQTPASIRWAPWPSRARLSSSPRVTCSGTRG